MKDGSVLEVTTVFEDTVIAVDTLSRPRRPAWPFLCAGALGLVLAALAFARGVEVAERNERTAAAFAGPAVAFRPERLAVGWEVLVGVGFAGGVLAIVLGLFRRERVSRAFEVSGFPMVARRGDEWVFARPEGMEGVPEAQVLARGARLRGTLGRTTYFVSADAPQRPRVGGAMGAMDERALASVGLSAILHAVLILIVLAVPGEKSGLASDLSLEDMRRVSVRMRPTEDPLPPPGEGKHAQAGGGPAMVGDPGKAGKPEAQAARSTLKVQRRAEGEPRVAPPSVSRARTAGILGYLRAHDDSFAVIGATGDLTTGIDDRDVVGWLGPGTADAVGWGVGPGGVGPGGSGSDPRSIGAGRYATGPWGPGGPGRTPFGAGPSLGPRRPRPSFHIGNVVAGPEGLDPNLIRRYLRQRQDEITYCYEKQLAVRPALAGTSTARFAIDQHGRVLQAQVSGLDPEVDGCIADTLRRIQFPASQTVYSITYPFTFHAAGM